MDDFSQIVRDMPQAEREALFASGLLRPLRMAYLMERSLARATASPHPDHAPVGAGRIMGARVASPEPDTVPVSRSLIGELRDPGVHRASQSQPAHPDLLRRPPTPTGTRAERSAQAARPTDAAPLTRNLTTELQKGGTR